MFRYFLMVILCGYSLIAQSAQKDFSTMPARQDHPAIIFVSFSMPKQSLIAYLKQAQKIHAYVVIRGLVNNSFKETFSQISEIVKESGGGVELNPLLFKQFHIEHVPAVVVLANHSACTANQPCPDTDFDVLYGDIPLDAALKVVRDQGAASKTQTGKLLDELKEASHA